MRLISIRNALGPDNGGASIRPTSRPATSLCEDNGRAVQKSSDLLGYPAGVKRAVALIWRRQMYDGCPAGRDDVEAGEAESSPTAAAPRHPDRPPQHRPSKDVRANYRHETPRTSHSVRGHTHT